MSSKSSSVILITVVLGAIVGGILGYYLPHVMLSLSFIGQLWVNALNILVIPLVAASIIVAVAAMGHMKKVSRAIRNMIIYFASTSAIAVVIGLLAVLIIRPGVVTSSNGAFIPENITEIGRLTT
ncbi:MAG TPA: cation:dicarboxylase symporter family transporter, partial [candidate division Zixibacteria bacterium]|nr:cation:dicarboxylase symporter family transporter [candidate division Zixibacteria bacterium]